VRRRLRWVGAILVAAVAASWTAPPTVACSIEITSHRSDYRHARAVFVGEVLSVEEYSTAEGEANHEVRFRVEKRWKGPKATELTVWSDLGRVCGGGPSFEVGQRYVVYAHESASVDVARLEAAVFNRSRRLDVHGSERAAERRQLDSRWFRWRSRLPF
jgi:hypothetical protein